MFRTRFLSVPFLVLLLSWPVMARAQQEDTAPPSPPGEGAGLRTTDVIIVDVQHLLENSAAGRSANQQIEKLRKGYEKQISQEENRLKKREQDLIREREELSPAAFEKRLQAFQKDAQESQKMAAQRGRELDDAIREAREIIGSTALRIVAEIMQREGTLLAFDRAQVMTFSTSLDVTAEVLARLDRELPLIEIKAAEGKKGGKSG